MWKKPSYDDVSTHTAGSLIFVQLKSKNFQLLIPRAVVVEFVLEYG